MLQTTVLRRVSTLVVATLFAVAFMYSGAAGAQPTRTSGDTAVSAHTGVSKAAVRTAQHTSKSHQAQTDTQLKLLSTGPVNEQRTETSAVLVEREQPRAWVGISAFFSTDRAPPAR